MSNKESQSILKTKDIKIQLENQTSDGNAHRDSPNYEELTKKVN